MSQKLDLHKLESKSLDEVQAVKTQLEKRKSSLEALKAKGGNAWTSELQEELDYLAITLVDVDEVYVKMANEQAKAKEEAEKEEKPRKVYEPMPGTEKSVHVKLVHGRRFSSMTGKEISRPFIQIFSFGEWQLFKKNFKSLGYIIIEVLHDPYNDAAELVTTLK